LLSQNIEDDGDADSEDNCFVDREEREAYLAERKAKLAEKKREYNRAYSKQPEVVEKRKAKQPEDVETRKAKKDMINPQELAARAERKREADRAYRNRPDVIAKRQANNKAKKDAAQQSRLEKGYDIDQGTKKRRELDAIVESAFLSQDNHGFNEVSYVRPSLLN
jgi:hypothetical protein